MTIKKALVIGFIAASIVGTLLHFVFEWTGSWAPIGAISAVNESVWEHLKILFMPMLAFGVVEYNMYGRRLENFVTVRFLSILLGMAILTAGYYTYSGILGYDVMAVNIILFELALLTAYRFSYKKLKDGSFSSPAARSWSALGLLALLALFVIFTYYPPRLDIFIDTQTGGYGIPE